MKIILFLRAILTYGRITPCSGKRWSQCYNTTRGRLTFWFNDASHSTRILRAGR